MEIKIEGVEATVKKLQGLQRHISVIASQAINTTASKVQYELKESMKTVFDKPTPFTLNSLFLKPSTPSTLTATVFVKDSPRLSDKQHYLLPHITGIRRTYKRSEGALWHAGVLPGSNAIVPGKFANKDSYGNMSPGQIVQIISYFKAFGQQGYRANITDKRKAKMWKGTKKKVGTAFFAGRPGGGRLPFGIYQRFNLGHGSAIKPVMIFTKNRPNYRKHWPFEEIGRSVCDREFPKQFNDAINRVINSIVAGR